MSNRAATALRPEPIAPAPREPRRLKPVGAPARRSKPKLAYALIALGGAAAIGIAQIGLSLAITHDSFVLADLTSQQRELNLQASALEDANRWPESRQALIAALALAPNEPLILNFLGYAKLERGEDLEAAEAMIRKASELDPDNASITDSLGWALYKRGRTKEAVEILTKAAKGDPAQAEIHEHLGDALYKSGNRYEARYAWQAALVTADDDVTRRLKAKIETGLTPATAAP